MRPFSKEISAACFFYVGFTLILILISYFLSRPAPTTSGNLQVKSSAEELMSSTNMLLESWRTMLDKMDYDSPDFKHVEETKLFTKKFQKEKLEWIRFDDQLTLPKANTEKNLVDMGLKYRKLVKSKGFWLSDIKWGYSKNDLWLKLQTKFDYERCGKKITLPIAEITIIQPLKKPIRANLNWRGIIPETPPSLIPKPLPKPEPKPSDTKEKLPLPQQEFLPLPKPAPIPSEPKFLPPVKQKARVSIIIDDVGYVRGPAESMLQVPARLTWSFLPFSPYGKEYQAAAARHGFEIILHLPLEAVNPNVNPGPGVVRRAWSEEEIINQLNKDFDNISGLKGFNNHEGSAGTSDQRLMDIVMREANKRNIYFVDSYTINTSVAYPTAKKHQVPCSKRDIFIDHYDSYEEKLKALRNLIKLALKNGTAIGIGHVRNGTAEAIMEVLPEFTAAGVEIVPVSELVR